MDAQAQASVEDVAVAMSRVWAQVMRGSSGRMIAILEELDLSLPDVKALHALHFCGCELSVKELAERLGLSLPGASRTVDRLLERGWLERREDPTDRRIRRVRISGAGSEAVGRIESARLAGLQAWAGRLTPERRAALLAALPADEDLTP